MGYSKPKGTARMGGGTYATVMCGQSYGAIVAKTGLRGNCGGLEIFASCDQQLAMWHKTPGNVAIWRADEEADTVLYEESLTGSDFITYGFASVGVLAIGFGLYTAFKRKQIYREIRITPEEI